MWKAEENLKTGKFLGKLKKHIHKTKTEMLYIYTQAISEQESQNTKFSRKDKKIK